MTLMTRRTHPWAYPPSPYIQGPTTSPTVTPNQPTVTSFPTAPTQEEFDALKKEVELLRQMLTLAKGYDTKNNEPNCETEAKFEQLRKIAAIVGIDLDEVLKSR